MKKEMMVERAREVSQKIEGLKSGVIGEPGRIRAMDILSAKGEAAFTEYNQAMQEQNELFKKAYHMRNQENRSLLMNALFTWTF